MAASVSKPLDHLETPPSADVAQMTELQQTTPEEACSSREEEILHKLNCWQCPTHQTVNTVNIARYYDWLHPSFPLSDHSFVLFFLYFSLYSLEGLGLGRDHNRSGPHATKVPRAQFRGWAGLGVGGRRRGGCRTGFRSLRNCLIVARWRPRIRGGLAALFQGHYSGNAAMLGPRPHVVHHGLGGGGARARAARAGGGYGVWLHQFGFGSLCILSKMSTRCYYFTQSVNESGTQQ